MSETTTDLAVWLLAAIAEDERVAVEASPGPWTYGDIESVAGGSLYGTDQMVASILWDNEDPRPIRRPIYESEADANGAHIARHDPARVLAECAAKRQIVELAWDHFGDPEFAGGMEYAHEQVVAILAQPYRDRPGWRDEWATT